MVSDLVHMVGKHQTFGHMKLGLPPAMPCGPLSTSRSMFGLTQYGQQCPGSSVSVNPPGHLSSPHEPIGAQGSEMSGIFCFFWTSINVLLFLSRAMAKFPSKMSRAKSRERSANWSLRRCLAEAEKARRARQRTRMASLEGSSSGWDLRKLDL